MIMRLRRSKDFNCRPIASQYGCHFNTAANCGAPPPPVNGFLQSYNNTTEGSVVVFQCEPGFVLEEGMRAVCGSNGQWSPKSPVAPPLHPHPHPHRHPYSLQVLQQIPLDLVRVNFCCCQILVQTYMNSQL